MENLRQVSEPKLSLVPDLPIPYGTQEITAADIDAVVKVLKSPFLTQGPAVEDFETKIAKTVGATYAVAVSNGTAALYLTYLAHGLTEGDAIFVPAMTFAATANAALFCGATAVFVDVDPRTGLLSLKSLKEAVQVALAKKLRPKILTTVHLGGRPSLSTELIKYAAEISLPIVEDACHALGAQYRLVENSSFRMIGSCADSSAAILSFHPVKHITTGEGGAITTNSIKLAQKIRSLRAHGIAKSAKQFIHPDRAYDSAGRLNPWYQEMHELGFNFRLGEMESALGASQIQRLRENINARRNLADFYRQELKEVECLEFPEGDSVLTRHAYHLFSLQIDFEALGKTRAQVMNELIENGVGTQVHYIPVPLHPYYEKSNRVLTPKLPGAMSYYNGTLSIPMYAALWKKGKERVVAALRKVCTPK